MRSSISVNAGLTPASSGKRRRTEPQNEWIVWIFNPPGASMARAKRVRARDSRSGVRLARSTPLAASVSTSLASSIIAQVPRLAKRRFCISIAAALV